MDTVKSPFARVCLRGHRSVSAASEKLDRSVGSSAVPLRVIRLIAQIGVQELVAFWLDGILARRFEGNEDRVDFAQNLRIIILEHPTLLDLVVRVEDSETLGSLAWPFLLPLLRKLNLPVSTVASPINPER